MHVTNPIYYVLIPFLASFIGALPFGAINLSVINITINKSFGKGMQFSLSASLVEIGQVLIAIFFGIYISRALEEYSWIQVLVFLAFMGIGIYNIVRKTHPRLSDKTRFSASEFTRGFLVAVINPQAIPFWIFVLTFIAQQVKLEFMGYYLFLFVLGVFIGKLAALLLFALLSNFLKSRLQKSCNLINRTLGVTLLCIGIVQAVKFFIR